MEQGGTTQVLNYPQGSRSVLETRAAWLEVGPALLEQSIHVALEVEPVSPKAEPRLLEQILDGCLPFWI